MDEGALTEEEQLDKIWTTIKQAMTEEFGVEMPSKGERCRRVASKALFAVQMIIVADKAKR